MGVFQGRRPSLAKIALGACLLLLVSWLVYDNLSRGHLKKNGDSLLQLEKERKNCLYRQGVDLSGRLAPSNDTHSQFSCGARQYPASLCTVNMLYLNHSDRRFVTRVKDSYAARFNSELSTRLWPIITTSTGWPVCTQYIDEAFIFTVDNSATDEQYFHLHMSAFIPLFSLLALRKHLGPPILPGYRVGLMPAIEDYSLQTIDWNSDAFSEDHKFGILQQMMEVFAGATEVVPLVTGTLAKDKDSTTCIRVAHFGTGSINASDVVLQEGFSRFMQGRLGLPLPFPQPTEPFVCLAKRSSNRRILNEGGLVAAVSKFAKIQVVQFDALSYREQVAQMQQFTVLIGFSGGELINALYMPLGSVTIQLVPYEALSLDTEKYARIVRARGPYFEWHNKYEKNSRPNQIGDTNNNPADTLVHVEEFVEVVKEALKLGINSRLVRLQGP